MGNIVLLDDLTINKIAAGEVIERPASVVKEMIENSIDAGAKNITVEIKNGGISLIKITDDGCGISEDDMEIAFERHATSKIRTADDLEKVKTMGFRGEALASIAAIAKVEMISKKQDTDVAHKIIVEGGKTLEFTEAARSVGTTITVQNLFYNTPVRYKFLKKDYTEAGYIEDAVTRVALINRNVAIKLISNGKTVVQTTGNGDLKTVIYSIYGKDIASEIIEVDYDYEGMKVSGVIGKPVIARGNRGNQLFFLNGRYIKDKNLTAAADQAYKGMIPVGRYGFIVLNLEINPKLVDVNVHPAKLEVRFEEETKVFKAIYHAIKTNLAKSELVANVEKEELTENEKNVENKAKELNRTANEILNNYYEEKKGGITGLFQKIVKEPEETQEEINNNHLEEIFKFRHGMENELPKEEIENKENSIKENTNNITKSNKENEKITLAEEKEEISFEIPKIINDQNVNKNISLGNTLISSDTKEIDLTNSSQENNEKEDTAVTNKEEINSLPQNTIVLEKNEEKVNKEEQKNKVISNEDQFSKLFESKIELDSTQSIDTNKVREALKEDKFINNPEFDQMYKKTFGVEPFAIRKEKELEEIEKLMLQTIFHMLVKI